jgi:hypothetical protein
MIPKISTRKGNTNVPSKRRKTDRMRVLKSMSSRDTSGVSKAAATMNKYLHALSILSKKPLSPSLFGKTKTLIHTIRICSYITMLALKEALS